MSWIYWIPQLFFSRELSKTSNCWPCNLGAAALKHMLWAFPILLFSRKGVIVHIDCVLGCLLVFEDSCILLNYLPN